MGALARIPLMSHTEPRAPTPPHTGVMHKQQTMQHDMSDTQGGGQARHSFREPMSQGTTEETRAVEPESTVAAGGTRGALSFLHSLINENQQILFLAC